MDKMNKLSFKILDETKELKEKSLEYQNSNPHFKNNQYSSLNNLNVIYKNYLNNINDNKQSKFNNAWSTSNTGGMFWDSSNQLKVINETKAVLLYSIEKTETDPKKVFTSHQKQSEFGPQREKLLQSLQPNRKQLWNKN